VGRSRTLFASVSVRAALLAGIAAGVIATAIEIALWTLHGDPLPATLYRDMRLAAAIAMGSAVLLPPATFDTSVALVATLVHFALSILYALLLAPVIANLGRIASIATGALFGVALYVVNLFGFTIIYPWFAATRDAVTLTAHVAFGVAVAVVYRMMSPAAAR